MNSDRPWSDAGRESVAASITNTTWRERLIEPDRTSMTAAKAFGWALVTIALIGLFLFAAAVTG